MVSGCTWPLILHLPIVGPIHTETSHRIYMYVVIYILVILGWHEKLILFFLVNLPGLFPNQLLKPFKNGHNNVHKYSLISKLVKLHTFSCIQKNTNNNLSPCGSDPRFIPQLPDIASALTPSPSADPSSTYFEGIDLQNWGKIIALSGVLEYVNPEKTKKQT